MIRVPHEPGRPVAVLGLGKSGLVAARALAASGAEVWAWDDDAAKREALAHCDEMIGAELRPVLSFRPGTTLEEMTAAIVRRGEFHSEIIAAAAWITERGEIAREAEQ